MANLSDVIRATPRPKPQGTVEYLHQLLRKSADDYDELPWYGQAALSANPITNVPIAAGQMDKYASMGDYKGMGITALGALLSPVKVAGIVGRGVLRSLSPAGVAANAADTAVELPEAKQVEWSATRAAELAEEEKRKEEERQSRLRTQSSMNGVRG